MGHPSGSQGPGHQLLLLCTTIWDPLAISYLWDLKNLLYLTFLFWIKLSRELCLLWGEKSGTHLFFDLEHLRLIRLSLEMFEHNLARQEASSLWPAGWSMLISLFHYNFITSSSIVTLLHHTQMPENIKIQLEHYNILLLGILRWYSKWHLTS